MSEEILDNLDSLAVQRGKINKKVSHLELSVADPSVTGYTATAGTEGKSTDDLYWKKIGAGDTDWEQILIATDGQFVANIELADVGDLVLDDGVLGLFGRRPVLGDGLTTSGRGLAMQQDNYLPDEYTTVTSVGGDDCVCTINYVGVSTGVCISVNGGAPIYTAGTGAVTVTATATGAPQTINIWPATSTTSGVIGVVSLLVVDGPGVTSIDISRLKAIQTFTVNDTSLLKELDISRTDTITQLNISDCTSLTYLNYIMYDELGSGAVFNITNTGLTTLDFSGLRLGNCLISYNSNLTSINAEGALGIAGTVHPHYPAHSTGILLYENSLDGQALDDIYSGLAVSEDLPHGKLSLIALWNPVNTSERELGWDSDTPSIATDKNWTIVGT